jgi:hypothetical protein
MAIKYIIVLFVETPRKFITANNITAFIYYLLIYFAVINLRGVSTNKTIIYLVIATCILS